MKSAKKTLNEIFGYNDFRADQEACIKALKEKKDVFLLKPTGGGKSLIYQFLAAQGHKVVVLSPLIALMEDQVHQSKKFKIRSCALHSQMSFDQKRKNLRLWESNQIDLMFVTPERFFKSEFRVSFKTIKPEYFVVDEAHCASEWGHDFRPDYSKIKEIREFLSFPPTFCCTATATPETVEDVIESVGLNPSTVELFKSSVLRSNLNHDIRESLDFKDKLEEFMTLDLGKGPTIVYFSLIKTLESLAEHLDSLGVNYVKYHSKVPTKYRHRAQKLFIGGEVDLILATPAFGLGVDKKDVRTLVHFELPGSVEAYVQEFGRAGRDGKPSKCILLFSQEDIAQQMDFIKWAYPDAETIRWAYRQVELTKELGLPEHQVFELKKKMNFYNTYDFRLESAINILLRWGCLKKEGTKIFIGDEEISLVPDINLDLSADLIKNQQKKLFDLISLIRQPTDELFDENIKSYFDEEDATYG